MITKETKDCPHSHTTYVLCEYSSDKVEVINIEKQCTDCGSTLEDKYINVDLLTSEQLQTIFDLTPGVTTYDLA